MKLDWSIYYFIFTFTLFWRKKWSGVRDALKFDLIRFQLTEKQTNTRMYSTISLLIHSVHKMVGVQILCDMATPTMYSCLP